jgi:nucleoside-diphosphate-sugar epimerase
VVNEPVLVTGATGGLGRILTALLQTDGRRVMATGRNVGIGAALAGPGVRFAPADLARDPLAPLVEGVKTVFHLAALSAPWGPPGAFQAANVEATARLLEAAKAAGCRRFILASTPSIYTRPAHQIGLTEDSPLPARLADTYAVTKLAAERMVLGAAGDGFATVALRPRAIIGPHDTVLLPRLLRAADRGVLALPGGGRALIEPTDARDAARGFLAAEARAPSVSGRAFNLSGGVALPVAQLAAQVFARLGRKVRILAVPAGFAVAAAGLVEGVARRLPGQPEPVLTRYGAMVLGWSQTFDLAAAREALGWAPAFAPAASIDWALSAGHG